MWTGTLEIRFLNSDNVAPRYRISTGLSSDGKYRNVAAFCWLIFFTRLVVNWRRWPSDLEIQKRMIWLSLQSNIFIRIRFFPKAAMMFVARKVPRLLAMNFASGLEISLSSSCWLSLIKIRNRTSATTWSARQLRRLLNPRSLSIFSGVRQTISRLIWGQRCKNLK